MKYTLLFICIVLLLVGCGDKKLSSSSIQPTVVKEVNIDYFKSANKNTALTKVPCTLSDGTKADCYKIVTKSTPTDHQMGPWCPNSITQGADAGGIWLSDGKVYDVDGAFIKNLATFYGDNKWKMYDENGNISVTKTLEDCVNAANPNVGAEYQNFCVECLPSYITDVSSSYLIPVKPVFLTDPIAFGKRGARGGPPAGEKPVRKTRPEGGDRGDRPEKGARPDKGGGGMPSNRGIALNGVEFSAPAPVNNILSAYTIAPFDDAGGHINVHQGYHYHTATGVSFSVNQVDGHAPLIGYAVDGHGIYANLDVKGNEAIALDDCRGHFDETRGYHYHVDDPGSNNFINCIHGAYANESN